jgi:hypothetical protein
VVNNPLKFIDPTGMTCITTQVQDDDGTVTNSIADDGDLEGCEASGVAPGSGLNTITPETVNVNAQQGSIWQYIWATTPYYDSHDVALSPTAQKYVSAIANAAPTTCGGGGFGYVGVAGQKKGFEGFAGYLGEFDSNTGWSNNLLFEAGVHGGRDAPAYAGSSGGVALNSQHFEPLLFAPVAGIGGLVGSPSGAGFYLGTNFFGAGAYVNITSNAACNQMGR